jgi:hypothetical protein
MSRNLFDSKISYRLTTVFAPSDMGLYAVYPDSDLCFHSYWDTCREQFSKKFKKDCFGFFFSVKENHEEAVPNFIGKCENLLELNYKSKFFKTEYKNAIFIRPSAFWKSCYMRRSLFTLLCRQGIFSFIGARFEDILFGNVDDQNNNKIDASFDFARKTKNAYCRFFSGYTTYVGAGPDFNEYFPEKHGWVQEFKEKDSSYIKNVLVADKNCNLKINFFGNSIVLG